MRYSPVFISHFAACLLLVGLLEGHLIGQPFPAPIFIGGVREGETIIPIAVHSGLEWWSGWPFGMDQGSEFQVSLPESLDKVPASWLAPGLRVPRAWKWYRAGYQERDLYVRSTVFRDVWMREVDLTTTDDQVFEGGGPDLFGFAVAGDAEIEEVEALDEHSPEWGALWPVLQSRVDEEETASLRKGDADRGFPSTLEARQRVAPDAHLQKIRRPTADGTWYHFTAHKLYQETQDCSPITTINGILIQRPSGDVTVRMLSVSTGCGVGLEPTILASLYWRGPVIWIGRMDAEDGYTFYFYDPVRNADVDMRYPVGNVPLESRSLPRVDEARQCGFSSFRDSLQQLIATRDTRRLLNLSEFAASSADTDPRAAFIEAWRPHDPGSALWSDLGSVLALGGVCTEDGEFIASYQSPFFGYPGGPFLLMGSRVPLSQLPDSGARVITHLDDAIVRPAGGEEPRKGWRAVDAGDGRTGYVPARLLVTQPPEAHFKQINGNWRLVRLFAPQRDIELPR